MPKIGEEPPPLGGRPDDPYSAFDPNFRILAVDPGDTYVGMADFEDGRCLDAWECNPAESLRAFRERLILGNLDAIVIEEFRLYPWKATQQAFSQMKTAELIGAFRYLWASDGNREELSGHYPPVIWHQQGATIKKVIRAQLRARGVPLVAPTSANGPHANDAELHGYYFLSNQPDKAPRENHG